MHLRRKKCLLRKAFHSKKQEQFDPIDLNLEHVNRWPNSNGTHCVDEVCHQAEASYLHVRTGSPDQDGDSVDFVGFESTGQFRIRSHFCLLVINLSAFNSLFCKRPDFLSKIQEFL